MAKESVEVVYNGYLASIVVPTIGTFDRGEPKAVSAEDAESLLSHPDWKLANTKKGKEATE